MPLFKYEILHKESFKGNILQKITKQQLSILEPDTHYTLCTFYLDEEQWHNVNNQAFYQCSFRGKTRFVLGEKNPFSDCSFANLSIDLKDLPTIPAYVFSLNGLTNLYFQGADILQNHDKDALYNIAQMLIL